MMANKFTKSVLERQYLEKQRSGSAATGQRPEDSRAKDSAKGNLLAPESSSGVQGAVPEHIIPSPQGRGSELAAGIDEAFTRADATGQRPEESRAEASGTGNPFAPESVGRNADGASARLGSEVSTFTQNVTTGMETALQNNPIDGGAWGNKIPQSGGRGEAPKGSAVGEAPAVADEPKSTGMGDAMPDLVATYLIRTPERVAKNKTFYLDEAVINGIRSSAKKQKVTESKLVNDILGGVLGIHSL